MYYLQSYHIEKIKRMYTASRPKTSQNGYNVKL